MEYYSALAKRRRGDMQASASAACPNAEKDDVNVMPPSDDEEDEILGRMIYESSRTAQLLRERAAIEETKAAQSLLSMPPAASLAKRGANKSKKRKRHNRETAPANKKRVLKSFEQRIEDLRAYKEKHGHVCVKEKEDKSLYGFCKNMRQARNNPEKPSMTLTNDRIARLDTLGFDWTVKKQVVLKKLDEPRVGKKKTFAQRIEDLRAYKEKHGHILVNKSDDKSLFDFCSHMRYARNHPNKSKSVLTDDRIASLDALGFEWKVDEPRIEKKKSFAQRKKKSFAQRVEDLRAYKEEHGHINVRKKEDKGLFEFCRNTKSARKYPGKGSRKVLTAEDIASLDALGFSWIGGINKSVDQRIEDLRAYKEKHGNIRVKKKGNKVLYQFCSSMRFAHNNPGKTRTVLTNDRISALDALGFNWNSDVVIKSFEQRIEDLRAYKEKHGHFRVKKSEDKSLSDFCSCIRYARKHPDKSERALTDDRIASLDAMGFVWKTNNVSAKKHKQDKVGKHGNRCTTYAKGLAAPTEDTNSKLDLTPPALPPLCNLNNVDVKEEDPNVEEGIQYKAGGQHIEKEEVDVNGEDTNDEDGIEKVPV